MYHYMYIILHDKTTIDPSYLDVLAACKQIHVHVNEYLHVQDVCDVGMRGWSEGEGPVGYTLYSSNTFGISTLTIWRKSTSLVLR